MHFVVKNTPPPVPQTVLTAKLFPIVNEPEPEARVQQLRLEPEDLEDGAETKVVKARRGRRPAAASEVAETK